MDYSNWKSVLCEWVNCLKLIEGHVEKIDDIRNGQFLLNLYTTLTNNTSEDHETSLVQLLIGLIQNKYRKFNYKSDIFDLETLSDVNLLVLVSFLLHYTCIIDGREDLLRPMCQTLSTPAQIIIKTYLEHAPRNLTVEKVLNMAQNTVFTTKKRYEVNPIETGTPSSPLQDLFNRATPTSSKIYEKDRLIRDLRAELDQERLEKLDLHETHRIQIDQRATNEKMMLIQKNEEIQQLREEIHNLEIAQTKSKVMDEAEQKRLQIELKSLEQYVKELQMENEEIQNDGESALRKVSHLEEKCTKWQTKYNKLEVHFDKLSSNCQESEQQLIEAKRQCDELTRFLDEYRTNTISIMDNSQLNGTPKTYRNSFSSTENLANTVVDIQLNDAMKQNDSLNEKIMDLTRDLEDAVEKYTKQTEQIEILKGQHVDLEETIVQLETTKREDSEQFETIKMHLNQIQMENVELKMALQQSEEQIVHVQDDLDRLQNDKETEIEKLQYQLSQMQIQCEKSTGQYHLLDTEYTILKSQFHQLQEEYTMKLAEEKTLSEHTIQKLQSSVCGKKIEIKNLRKDVKKSQMNCKELNMKLLQVEERFVVVDNDLQMTSGQLKQCQKDKEDLLNSSKKTIEDLQNIGILYRDKICTLSTRINDLETNLHSTTVELQSAEENSQIVESLLQKTRKELDRLRTDIVTKEETVNFLQRQLQDEQEKSTSTFCVLKATEDKLNEVLNTLELRTIELVQVQKEKDDIEYVTADTIQDLKRKLVENQDSLTSLYGQWENLQKLHEQISGDLELAHKNNYKITIDLKTTQNSLQQTESDKNQMEIESQKKIDDLQVTLNNLEQKLKQINEEYTILQVDHAQINIQLQETNEKLMVSEQTNTDQIEKSKSMENTFKTTINDLSNQLAEQSRSSTVKIEDLYEELSTKQLTVEKLERTLMDLDRSLTQNEQQRKTLTETCLTLNTDLKSLQIQIEQCQLTEQEQKQQIEDLNRQLSQSSQTVGIKQMEIDDLNRLLKEHSEKLTVLEDVQNTLRDKEKSLQQLTQNLVQIECVSKQKHNEFELLKEQFIRLTTTLEISENRNRHFEELLGQNTVNLDEAQRMVQALEMTVERLNLDLKKSQENYEKLQEKNEDLNQHFIQINTDFGVVKKTNISMEQQIEMLQIDLNTNRGQLKLLTQNFNELLDDYNTITQNLHTVNGQYQELQVKYDSQTKDLDNQRKCVDDLNGKYMCIVEEQKTLVHCKSQLITKQNNLKMKLMQKIEKLDEVEHLNCDLNTAYETVRVWAGKQCENYEMHLGTLKIQVDNLTDQMKQMIEENASLQLTIKHQEDDFKTHQDQDESKMQQLQIDLEKAEQCLTTSSAELAVVRDENTEIRHLLNCGEDVINEMRSIEMRAFESIQKVLCVTECIEQTRQTLKTTNEEKIKLEVENGMLRQQLSDTAGQIVNVQGENRRLQDELNQLKSNDLQQLETQIIDLSSKLNRTKQTNDQLHEQIIDYKTQLIKSDEELSRVHSDKIETVRARDDEIVELRNSNRDLHKTVELKSIELYTINGKSDEDKERISCLESKLSVTQLDHVKQCEQMVAQQKQLEKHCFELIGLMEEKEQALIEEQKRHSAVKEVSARDHDELMRKYTTSEHHLNDLKQKFDLLQGDYERNVVENTTLRKRLDDLEVSFGTLESLRNSSEEKCANLNREYKELEGDLGSLQRHCDDINRLLSMKETKLTEMGKQYDDLGQTNEELQHKLGVLNREKQRLIDIMAQLEVNAKNCEQILDESRYYNQNKEEAKQVQVDQSEATTQDYEIIVNSLKNVIETNLRTIDDLRQTKHGLETEITTIHSKLHSNRVFRSRVKDLFTENQFVLSLLDDSDDAATAKTQDAARSDNIDVVMEEIRSVLLTYRQLEATNQQWSTFSKELHELLFAKSQITGNNNARIIDQLSDELKRRLNQQPQQDKENRHPNRNFLSTPKTETEWRKTHRVLKEKFLLSENVRGRLQKNFNDLKRSHNAILVQIDGKPDETTISEAYTQMVNTNSKLELEILELRKLIELKANDLSGMLETNRQLTEQCQRLRADNEMSQYKRAKDKEEFAQLLKEERDQRLIVHDIHTEYDTKLAKMKDKMYNLYVDEVKKLKMVHARELDLLQVKLAETETKYSQLKRHMYPVVNRPQRSSTISTTLPVNEDEDDAFSEKHLLDLKEGRCSIGRDSTISRMSELARRNTLVPPHLKSSYPMELLSIQPDQFREEDIKAGLIKNSITHDYDNDDEDTVAKMRTKKDVGRTAYKKPGPPTPSRNGGRLLLSGNEVHPLVAPSGGVRANPTPKKSTPSRIRALFMGRTTNHNDSPMGEHKNVTKRHLFQRPR